MQIEFVKGIAANFSKIVSKWDFSAMIE